MMAYSVVFFLLLAVGSGSLSSTPENLSNNGRVSWCMSCRGLACVSVKHKRSDRRGWCGLYISPHTDRPSGPHANENFIRRRSDLIV